MGAGFFRDWHRSLPGIRVVSVQLPGREERFGEPALTDSRAIARAVARAIEAQEWPRVVLLGYSFGALLAFETARLLENQGRCAVPALIACARGAPQEAPRSSIADGPDEAFVAYLRSLGGLPPEVENDPVLLDFFLPLIRADFRANDSYHATGDERIDAPIVTLVGSADAATRDDLGQAWKHRTRATHDLVEIEGGHFFVLDNKTATFAAIAKILGSFDRSS
jgi:surfactin synthase thioesterase subunit